jgi:glutamate dehydrogenase/leucine dehydrogenase
VINAGGVIGAAQEGFQLGQGGDEGFDESKAFAQTERIAETLQSVFALAEREGLHPHAAAVTMAKDKILKMRS